MLNAINPIVLVDLAAGALAGSIKRGVTETNNGVTVTRFDANFDVAKTLEKTRRKAYPEQERKAIEAAFELLTLKGDVNKGSVWLDDAGRLRGFSLQLKVSRQRDFVFGVNLALVINNFGKAADVRVPGDSEVLEAASMVAFLRCRRAGDGGQMTGRLKIALTPLAVLLGSAAVSFLAVALLGDGALSEAVAPVVGFGVVFGALNALVTVGLILIYRSTRILNFAQAGFGLTATMFYLMLASVWHWNFWLALVAALVVAGALSFAIEALLVRRFARVPRLVLTVVTIALAQTLGAMTLFMPRLWGFVPDPEDPSAGLAALPASPPPTPFDRWTIQWDPVVMNGNYVAALVVAIVAMVGLTVFLRYTRAGAAVRGAAENVDRAELLGINVANLSSIVWIVAGVLAAIAGILNGMVSRSTVSTTAGLGALGGVAGAIGLTTLIRALAAGVIARMESVPVAVAAALGLGMVEQGLFWATRRSDYVNVFLVLVIIASLVSQRTAGGRADSEVSSWEATEEIRNIPFELAHLPQVRAGVRRSLWILTGLVALWPWVTSPSQTNLGGIYAIYGIIGVSLVILTGWAGQISLGHFGFVAVGAAVAGNLAANVGLPFPVAVIGGTLAAGVVAVAVGLPALRIQGLFLAVTTLAFSLAVATWFMKLRLGTPAGLAAGVHLVRRQHRRAHLLLRVRRRPGAGGVRRARACAARGPVACSSPCATTLGARKPSASTSCAAV